MFESPVRISDLIKFIFFSLVIVVAISLSSFFDGRTKIVFCNVGQGDAAYLRINNKIDVLIDAGPDKSVLSCLGKYMPFWDREIELAFLSHPNDDHYNGYFFITDRYKIDKFITVKSSIISKTYQQLINKIKSKNIIVEYETAGNNMIINRGFGRKIGMISIFWPPDNFESSQDNDYSLILLFEENEFRVLFTGDASPFILGRLSHGAINKINVLKVPHHGSKNGLTKIFLDLADPTTAVISVGKGNYYGHPHKEVLDMLKAKNIKILRTDEEGDIEFRITNDK